MRSQAPIVAEPAPARTRRRWPAFVALSTLLHGAVLASLSWIPLARGVAAAEADDAEDDGYVIQLSLHPASTEANAETERATPTASEAQLAPEPEAAPPPPELAHASPPRLEPAFEIEPEPSPEPPSEAALAPVPPAAPAAPVVTTIADEAPALAQGPTPPASATSPTEETLVTPATPTPTAAHASPTPEPASTRGNASAASDPKPASRPGAAKDAGASGLGALDDGFRLRALRSDRPEYPEDARRRNEEGSVTCRLTIDRDGRVVEVVVVISSGSDSLDRAAVRALKRWRFEPLAKITDRERVHAVQKLSFELHARRN